MTNGDTTKSLSYPIRSEAALEPPAEWEELRQGCPVAPVTLPSGDEASLVTRYDDVREVLSDPRFVRPVLNAQAARMSDSDSGGAFNSEMASVIPQTGSAHQNWRRMISKWFTTKRMKALRPRIEAMADQLIDEMIMKGQPTDLKAGLGFPLPVWVICDMLGVPESDRDSFAYWSDTLLSLTRYEQDEINAAQTEFLAYMAKHIEAKRKEPGDDLLSDLITATDADGQHLSDATLIATGQGLLVAGHETTANMIGKMIAMLLADRSRWEQLLEDRSLIPSAVEEVLRFDANAGFGMPRFIDEDAELAGTQIASGTTVVCSMAAANRDDQAFPDAAKMDLTRVPNTHLAFGAGSHSCIGQALARTELQATLEVLLRRVPDLTLAVPVAELTRLEGLLVGGLTEVPVRW